MSELNLYRLVTFCFAWGVAWAQPQEDAAISAGTLTSHVHYLASDELGGRGVGSEGIEKAAKYIADQFADYGLKPGGDEGGYYQSFAIPLKKELTDRCRLEIVGTEIQPEPRRNFIPFPFSSSETFEGEVAFVGYGIVNKEKQHDDYAGIDVQGKAALMFRHEPEDWSESGQATQHAMFLTKAAQAKEHGAVAVLIVNIPGEDPDALYDFQAFGDVGDYGLPMFHISRSLADEILDAAGSDPLAVHYKRLSDPHEKLSFVLKNIRLRGHPGLDKQTAIAKNVIAILEGKGSLANEYVVVGAHYDHLGIGRPTMRPHVGDTQPDEKLEIHNGADDNASGTAGVLELARVLSADKNSQRRSFVFAAFSAEEIGLLGSMHYVTQPVAPLDKTVAMINFDMIGRMRKNRMEVHGTGTAVQFEKWVDKCAESHELEVQMIESGIGPSDHTPFYQRKIPVLFLFTGLHLDYHKPSDDADKVNYEGMVSVLKLATDLANHVSTCEDRPTYQKVSSPDTGGTPRFRVTMGIMPSYGPADDEPGWVISGVVPGRAAAEAGMKDDDRIYKIDGEEVTSVYDYMRVLSKFEPGQKVSVIVLRDGQEKELTVTLEGR